MTTRNQVALLLLGALLVSHALLIVALVFALTMPAHRQLFPTHRGPHFWLLISNLTVMIAVPTGLGALWVSRRITAPLRALAAHTETIDLQPNRAELPEIGTAEIRQLAQSFNRLMARLATAAEDQRRMIASISHDLRSPLTRLRLRLDQIEDPGLRLRLQHEVETMQSLVQSTLSLTRAQENHLELEEIDLAALLQTIADTHEDSGHAVTCEGTPHLPIQCDPGLFRRAIENLVENALKFAGHAKITLAETDDKAIIDIADHGPGLPDPAKEQAFTPFYRADESRNRTEGSGLGLTIARTIVLAHGGSLSLHDNAPCGLVARIVLPVEARLRRAGALPLHPTGAIGPQTPLMAGS